MTPPKAGQVWSWYHDDLVYLIKKLHLGKSLHLGKDYCQNWEWFDLNKGLYFRCPLTVGCIDGWELLIDT